MVEAANGLANNATLGVNITKTGVVTGTPTYNSNYNSWTFYVTIEGINLKCHSMPVAGTTTLNEGDTVEITGDLSAFGGAAQFNYNCADATFVSAGESGGEGGEGGVGGEGGETTGDTVSIVMSEIAAANNWNTSGSTAYKSFTVGDYITVSAAGTDQNTGKYYANGNNWRLYQKGSATLTIAASGGKTIASVVITYVGQNDGTLKLNGNAVTSGTAVTDCGSSVTFNVTSDSADNGQVRVTAIEIVLAD